MGNVLIKIGTVREVENIFSETPSGGMRIRAKIEEDKEDDNIPWAFPLLPKSLQTAPKKGEAVLVIADEVGGFISSQRYYIGPIISQPQYNSFCPAEDATTLLKSSLRKPVPLLDGDDSDGAFPEGGDVALIGRGAEDISLKSNNTDGISEVDIRAGIRKKFLENVIFNGVDPAYIQLKYKSGIATGEKTMANSLINIVADRINLMSNKDKKISHDIHDNKTLINESRVDEIMDSLHPLPMGDKLVELLTIIKGAILNHVHSWPGKEQCGDRAGWIEKLLDYKPETILSDFVRIS